MAMQMEPPRDGTPLSYAAATTLPASAQALHSPHNRITLPDLKTVLSNDFEPLPSLSRVMQEHDQHSASPLPHGAFPRIDQNHMHMAERTISLESGMASPVTTASVISVEDRNGRPLSVVSVEDENVLIAAQALSGLGNPDYARRGPSRPPAYPVHAALPNGEPEPLLELIAQAHPWVGTTIKGSISAYSTTKNFSPRIVQYGANLVEKNIAFPVASAVGSVGEMTGVEYTVRRYLDARRPADVETGAMDGSNDTAMDVDARPGLRRLSIDSLTEPLPVYGSTRPPSYREEQSPAAVERFGQQVRPRERPMRSWSSQFLVTTSGLSVALSSTSRNSLRFCLTLLGSSALRVSELTRALKSILEQYEQRRRDWHHRNSDPNLEKGDRPQTPDQDDSARQLADQIKAQSESIMQTLQHVVNSVSNYAGGALPDNARQFVRSQLMSLPQRWRVVSGSESTTDSETSKSAERMIGFAKEGLDMITQVSNVMKATLDSAEKWLERVGRQDPQEQRDQTMQDVEPTYPPQTYHHGTEKL